MSRPVGLAGGKSDGSATNPGIGPFGKPATRRGTEAWMLGFAAVIMTAALVLVEANQEQELTLAIVWYGLAYFGSSSSRTWPCAAGRPTQTR